VAWHPEGKLQFPLLSRPIAVFGSSLAFYPVWILHIHKDYLGWIGMQQCKDNIPTMLCSPDVANIPPTMPHKRTRNCQNGWWLSRMWTRSDDRSYFTKIPGTPWLPFEWLIVRFLSTTMTNISVPAKIFLSHITVHWSLYQQHYSNCGQMPFLKLPKIYVTLSLETARMQCSELITVFSA